MNKKLIASIVALVGLAGILASWESFDQKALASLETSASAFSKEAQGLTIIAKKYTPQESKSYLNRNLLNVGYQPMQVTVQNNTAEAFTFSLDGISQITAPVNKVANSVTKKALPRSIGLKVASFFFWPFMIPSTVDGIHLIKSHKKLKKDYLAKGVKEMSEEIAPYSTFHRVVFIPKKELRDTLTVTLFSKEEKVPVSFISPILNVDEKIQLEKIQ